MLRILLVYMLFIQTDPQIFVPFKTSNRQDLSTIKLTKIGQFGLMRKARPTVPEHYHTGIDIKRPGQNYDSEPIFPIASGKVISKRTDGPYANIIIEHDLKGLKFWTLYEHIAGVNVKTGEPVTPETKIARFMNKDDLNKYGWQFDHFHLEIIKVKPKSLKPTKQNPERYFDSYSLICYEKKDLEKYYYNPLEFLNSRIKK